MVEEFATVMPHTRAGIAFQRAEQWRVAFEQIDLPADKQTTHTTFSGGVAEFPAQGTTADEILRAADQALYAAKAAGRNCIVKK